MPINIVARKAGVQRIINRDPWDVTMYRKGRRAGVSAETTFTLVGTIKPAGSRGAPLELTPTGSLTGEGRVTRYAWVLLAPFHATDVLLEGDELVAVQQSSSVTRNFTVVYNGQYAFKQEAIISERQR